MNALRPLAGVILFPALLGWGCATASRAPQAVPSEKRLRTFHLKDAPVIGKGPQGRELRLGGFSGLHFTGKDEKSGELTFLTHTDRGPNLAAYERQMGEGFVVGFPLPRYQPEWVRLALNPVSGELRISERIPLRKKDGTPVTGLPNRPGNNHFGVFDERPLGVDRKPLESDPLGLDLEAIVPDRDGDFWMGDEYRPSICRFSPEGVLQERFVPDEKESRDGRFGTSVLPEVFSNKRTNRGFEALAFHGERLYAFLQSPLDNPDSRNDHNGKFSSVLRVLEFDPVLRKPTGQYLYLLDDPFNDRKIGDAVVLPDGDFLILEQTGETGVNADKKLYRLSLAGATDVQNPDFERRLGKTLETARPEELKKAGIQALKKTLVLDLAAIGYDFVEKAEGLALVDEDTVAILSDNDFSVNRPQPTSLTLVTLRQ